MKKDAMSYQEMSARQPEEEKDQLEKTEDTDFNKTIKQINQRTKQETDTTSIRAQMNESFTNTMPPRLANTDEDNTYTNAYPNNYIWWDGLNPNSRVHIEMAKQFIEAIKEDLKISNEDIPDFELTKLGCNDFWEFSRITYEQITLTETENNQNSPEQDDIVQGSLYDMSL